jgi:serine/threonine protein kinase
VPQDRAQAPFPPQGPSPQSGSGPDAKAAPPVAGGTYFLGRYRVVDEIGVGGMASVHLARMDGPGGFQKWVAIKRIHPHLVEDETFVNMFLDEARVAARISHPNVATVFELGKHDDTYWIAMEYLHGEPLREVMRRTEELGQPMPPEIACRVIADAAEGLHSAHELLGRNGEKLQLVHRDVTPHNLFVTYDGCTKVVDFGIAKFSSRMANTRAGTLKGKLAYMSPEQVAGEAIDRRTDVFALGVVLWELTTGQRLFRMENDLDTLAKVQECNVPRPSSIVRGYPIDLEKIVLKALAKNKNERYRTSRELSRALQSLLMRRGLFIASDEVASYMTSVFGDRIQKREAHLRWAAEVTQTIDIDKMKAMAPSPWQTDDGSILTYNSEVQASQGSVSRGPPRPAAGLPPTDSQPSASSPGHPTPLAGPAAAQSFDPRATMRLGPASPVARAPAGVPRPASVAKPVDRIASDDPPTLARHDDPPTLARPRGAPVGAPPMEEFDDNVDTIVSESFPEMDEARQQWRQQQNPVPAAGGLPQTAVTLTQAASPVAMAVHSGPRPAPPRQPTLPPMPAVMVPAIQTQPNPMQQTMRMSPGPARAAAPSDAQLMHQQPLPHAAHPSLSNEYPPQFGQMGQSQQGYPQQGPVDMQRLFAPPIPNDQRTITAQALRGRVPVWAVAVASAVFGLMAFGLVVLLLTNSSNNKSAKASPSASASTPAPTGAPAVVAAAQPGPFVSARTQFAAAIVLPPPATDDSIAPPPAPSSAPEPPAPAPSAAAPIPTMNFTSLPTAPTVAPPPPPAPAPRPPPVAAAPAPAPQPAPAPTPAAASGGTGTLKVICFPGCDQVIDNGASLGPSPIVRRNATLGSHRIKLVWSDASTVVSTIVLADQTATVRKNHP